jgi:hydrogenase maturation protein HypF
MAEHGLDEPVIGVSFDGTGLGVDQAVWGGEFLVGDYAQFTRAAHLRYVRMPGGDQAAREPWRMAVSHLLDADCEGTCLVTEVDPSKLRGIERMVERGLNSPWTSSAGRLFDAVAAIARVRQRVTHEGQAAMQLEGMATDVADHARYPFEVEQIAEVSADLVPSGSALSPAGWKPSQNLDRVDTRPLIRAILRDVEDGIAREVIARRFHSTMVEIIAVVCERIRARTARDIVVLSGGVFLNALLTRAVCARLTESGFRVFRHRLVPPNDGGLSLGQVAVAAAITARTPLLSRELRANFDEPPVRFPEPGERHVSCSARESR